jgi:glutaredoxin-related protein
MFIWQRATYYFFKTNHGQAVITKLCLNVPQDSAESAKWLQLTSSSASCSFLVISFSCPDSIFSILPLMKTLTKLIRWIIWLINLAWHCVAAAGRIPTAIPMLNKKNMLNCRHNITTSIPNLKVYIFLKSTQVKFDQIFRKFYQQIWYFVDFIWKYISLPTNDIDFVFCMLTIFW